MLKWKLYKGNVWSRARVGNIDSWIYDFWASDQQVFLDTRKIKEYVKELENGYEIYLRLLEESSNNLYV